MNFDLKEHTHILVVSGSRAYGINHKDSDVDVAGVAIPPASTYFGVLNDFKVCDSEEEIATYLDLFKGEEADAIKREKLEGAVFEMKKFIKLAMDANPSIWDILFCREEEIRMITPIGEMLRENRDLFVSSKAHHTYRGYAMNQLKHIQRQRGYLMQKEPPTKPTREQFGLSPDIDVKQMDAVLSQTKKITDGWEIDLSFLPRPDIQQMMENIHATLAEINITYDDRWKAAARKFGLTENFIVLVGQEKKYRKAMEEYNKYHKWLKDRNPKRAALEEKFGFDTKKGAHLYRLMTQSEEILTTGKVNVWREDWEKIVAMRNGYWDYDRFLEWTTNKDKELHKIYKEKKYVVPKEPNRKKIDALCQEVIYLGIKGQHA